MNSKGINVNIILCKPEINTDSFEFFNAIKVRGQDNQKISFDILSVLNFWNMEIQHIEILYSIIHNKQVVVLGHQTFFEKEDTYTNKNTIYDSNNIIARFPVRDFPLRGPGIYQIVGHLVTNEDQYDVQELRSKIENGNFYEVEKYLSSINNLEIIIE